MFIVVGVLITLFLSTGIWVSMKLKKSSVDYDMDVDKYIEEESEANFARAKQIDAELFFSPNRELTDNIKLNTTDTQIIKLIAAVEKLYDKQMLCFDRVMSNKELKLAYGLANLDSIILYEGNFVNYIRAMINLGKELNDADILEETARIGSVFPNTYYLLTDIYAETNQKDKLYDLKIQLMKNKPKFDDDYSFEQCNKYINEKIGGSNI
jgi:hypothetical protein